MLWKKTMPLIATGYGSWRGGGGEGIVYPAKLSGEGKGNFYFVAIVTNYQVVVDKIGVPWNFGQGCSISPITTLKDGRS